MVDEETGRRLLRRGMSGSPGSTLITAASREKLEATSPKERRSGLRRESVEEVEVHTHTHKCVSVEVPKAWGQALRFVQESQADRLDFGRTGIGNAGVGALALLLVNIKGALSHVDQLLLDKCEVGAAGVLALSEAFAQGALPLLDKLSLAGNRILDSGLGALARAIKGGALPRLKELCLDNVGIGDDGLVQLRHALVTSREERPAEAVVDGPARLCELKELDLSDNDICDSGTEALADALEHGALPRVEVLKLSGNSLNNAAVSALAPALKHLRCLKELSLDDNLVEDGGVVALAQAIAEGWLVSLHLLALDENLISDEGAVALAMAAKDSAKLPLLESIDLDGNEVGNKGYDAFAEALSCGGMPCLKLLEIDDDMLGHQALNHAVKSRSISLR